MHNFKKVILSAASITVIFLICSVVWMAPFLNSEAAYYQDTHLRDSLEGDLNVLTVGASNGLCALDPRIMDEQWQVCSYNLSAPLMTLDARMFFLQKEISRNPIHTVIMEISGDTLTRQESNEKAEGDSFSVARLNSGFERIQYIVNCVKPHVFLNLYAHLGTFGTEYWLSRIADHSVHNVNYEAKGFCIHKANDIHFSEETAIERYKYKVLDSDFTEENSRKLIRQIEYCKENNIRVILVIVPKADAYHWSLEGEDDFYKNMLQLSNELNCEFYDFNLLGAL